MRQRQYTARAEAAFQKPRDCPATRLNDGAAFDVDFDRQHVANLFTSLDAERPNPRCPSPAPVSITGDAVMQGRGIAAALARNHRVMALDNRNHGKSDTPQPDGPGRPQDVLELMDHLKIDRAHVHGYSMGGGFTAWMLATHPDRLLSAALGGSGIFETDEKLAAQASALDKPVPPLTSDSSGSPPSAAANALLRRASRV